ncbi:MAG TPA: imidazoleglycerol-phosphate dehydratase HisB [Chloroflexota bacterium]|nr:imidazoleglycerol-phosphate dehydratase HisB [Chloroflexota bacterium]
MNRHATVTRNTKETQISVTLTIEGSGQGEIATGMPFMDHMLGHIRQHGLFDLTITAHGDLEIDEHHTVEDVAITLAQALTQALGDKKGITRMGWALVPMDEALAQVAVDISGRGVSALDMTFANAKLGTMESQLLEHFVDSLARHAGININAKILQGDNDHHRAEALFKALGRALDQATALDPRLGQSIPSTKGTL